MLMSVMTWAGDRELTVTGKGEGKVQPNVTQVNVQVRSLHDTYAAAYEVAEQNMNALSAAMADCRLDTHLPKTTYFNIVRKMRARYDGYHNYVGEEPAGYELQQDVLIRLGMDNALLTRVVRAVGARMQDIELSISFTNDNPNAVQIEMIRMAVTDARSKAEAMAQAAGCKLGKVKTILFDNHPVALYAQARKMSAVNEMLMCTEESLDITPDDMRVSEQVTVVWELK